MNPLFEISWLQWLLVALVLAQVSIFSITLHLHRSQAHRALDLHPVVSHPMRFWLWLSTAMSTVEWVAVHRKHHAHCETPEDPHSPKHYGLGTVLLKGAVLYAKARSDKELVARYGRGVPVDWLERNVYVPRKLLGPAILIVTSVLTLGFAKGLALCAVLFLWSPVWAAGVINGLAHAKGYRGFDTQDESRNLVPWGLWIGGEELHNNHHAHATSAKLSYHWWEVDIGWGAIVLLRALGLATVRKAVTPPGLTSEPAPCTPALLNTVAQHRLAVSRWYQKAWRATLADLRERGQLSKIQSRQLKTFLSQAHPPASLHSMLRNRKELELMRAHWHQWQQLWTDRKSSSEELVARLSQWCDDAESSGIAALRTLSLRMRSMQTG
jgi:stearoyl-CoA desaturase (Delta-9 desaturase)